MIEEAVSSAWLCLDKAHLRLLSLPGDSPAVPGLRSELENALRSFLSLVPSDRKFVDPELLESLFESVERLPGFSAGATGEALRALEEYAANLLKMPWRNEFREIREYSGYFKHNVQSHLLNPGAFLLKMGYDRADEAGLYILREPIRREAVIKVARDCLLASMECAIMESIAKGVSQMAPEISYKEILNFRRAHVGGPESAIRSLLYEHARSGPIMSPPPHPPKRRSSSGPMIPLTILDVTRNERFYEDESNGRLSRDRFYEPFNGRDDESSDEDGQLTKERFYDPYNEKELRKKEERFYEPYEGESTNPEEENEDHLAKDRFYEPYGDEDQLTSKEDERFYELYNEEESNCSSDPLPSHHEQINVENNHSDNSSTSDQLSHHAPSSFQQFSDPSSSLRNIGETSIFWSCPSCTFDNEEILTICAMCSKSRRLLD